MSGSTSLIDSECSALISAKKNERERDTSLNVRAMPVVLSTSYLLAAMASCSTEAMGSDDSASWKIACLESLTIVIVDLILRRSDQE